MVYGVNYTVVPMPRSSLFFTAFTFINLLEFMELHANLNYSFRKSEYEQLVALQKKTS